MLRPDTPMSWPVLDREVLAEGHVSTFVNETIETPDGQQIKRQYLTHPGAVAVVAWREDTDDIAVLRQYRHPVRAELVEIPAGLLDLDGEAYVVGAQRELAEEVALAAERWDTLVDICTTPGACAETLRVFLARGISETSRPEGFVLEGEEAAMTWSWEPRADLVDAVLGGDTSSPTLVAGILALETARLGGRLDDLRPADAPWPLRER